MFADATPEDEGVVLQADFPAVTRPEYCPYCENPFRAGDVVTIMGAPRYEDPVITIHCACEREMLGLEWVGGELRKR